MKYVHRHLKRGSFLVVGLLFASFVAAPNVFAAGYTWTDQTGAGSQYWAGVASSSDGSRVITAVNGGDIYTSSDYGAHWTDQTNAPTGVAWNTVTSSASGQYLAAAIDGPGDIYTSNDYGAHWTDQTLAGSHYWWKVVSSANGQYLVAAEDGGGIYTSSDYGVHWTAQTNAPTSASWHSLAVSADGKYAVAGTYHQDFYTSSDYGVHWTDHTEVGTGFWINTAATSATGQYMYIADGLGAGMNGGYLYASSDYGATWTQQTAAGASFWGPMSASADGSHLVEGSGYAGNVYTSSDYGTSWSEESGVGNGVGWMGTAISADGSRIIAAESSEDIWTGYNPALDPSSGNTVSGSSTTLTAPGASNLTPPNTGYGAPASSSDLIVSALATGAIIATGAGLVLLYRQRPRIRLSFK